MKRSIYVLWFFLAGILSLQAQGGLEATLDSTHMLIGGRMYIDLRLDVPADFEPLEVKLDGIDTIGAIEILGQPEWNKQGTAWQSRLGITAFDTGFFLLPPVSVSGDADGVAQTFHSKRLALEVHGVPIDTSGVKPIRPIIEEEVQWTDFKWILFAVGILILFLLLVWLIRRIRKTEQEVAMPVPEVEAHILALEKIEALEKRGLWQQGLVKAYYIDLGDILREYFENRFGFPALEMTTGELVKSLKAREELSGYAEKAGTFFNMSDLVKFAKATPESSVHQDWMNWVRDLVLATRKVTENKQDENGTNG